MNQYPLGVHPRLHMGCGESLRSKLLLAVPPPLHHEQINRAQRKHDAVKTTRGRTRG